MGALFSWVDYFLFVLMLVLSAVIGIYYGFFKSQSTANEYLLGGKRMNMWPIALSLISSCMSGIPLLTFPTEVYLYGANFTIVTLLVPFVALVTYYVYIPVFYKIQVTSTYEYFKLRFDNRLRVLASIFYTIYMVLYLPLVIFVPALALSQVTGMSIHILTPIICGVCIFYTTLGGLKAVVWTDALQFFVMIGSMFVMVIVGVVSVGGLDFIWSTAQERGRLNIIFTPDPTVRDTFWTGTVSSFVFWVSLVSVNQSTIQKCLSLSTIKEVRNSLCVFAIGMTCLVFFIYFCGYVMLAKYYLCDPFLSKQIQNINQMVPYYVMDVASNLPGLPGLFVSGILSAALSTLSAAMNCLAATIFEDFIKPFLSKDLSDRRISIILKCLVLFIGIMCTSLVYVAEHLGDLLPMAMSCLSIAGGPLLGLFSVGMLVPMVNSIGALSGGIVSIALLAWMTIGGRIYRSRHPYPTLSITTDGCPEAYNITNGTISRISSDIDDGLFLYKISHVHYSMIGVCTVFIVAIVVSYFTNKKFYNVNKDCISPVAHCLLQNNENVYQTVVQTADIVKAKS